MSESVAPELFTDEARHRTLAATVWLPGKGGQGVLVPAGFILTAAHCVEWYASGGMVLGDHCLESVEAKTGAAFRLAVYAVEPVADIAVLGPPDEQEFEADAEAYEAFRETTAPVPVSVDDFELNDSVGATLLTHRQTWIALTATRCGFPGMPLLAAVALKAETDIDGGTSGGPIIDAAGRLVGIVSNAGGEPGVNRQGTMPRPHLALPAWIWRQIQAAQTED